ncbi:MAG: hypothetical protein R2752_22435 [Vicinamibacterales bacterium]
MAALACAGAVGLAAVLIPAPLAATAAHRLDPQQRTVLDDTLVGAGTRPRLGIPDFIVPGSEPALVAAAKTAADVLWADLDFEREFYMVDRARTAAIPVTNDPMALNFTRWQELGVQFVVLGRLVPTSSGFDIELRLIQVGGDAPGSMSFGQRYSPCTTENPRACAHFIADDMHKQIRRLDGVAQTRLAFVSDRSGARMAGRPTANAGGAKEIYISDYDGANVRQVTVNRSLALNPAWSPDGTALAYTLYPLVGAPAPSIFINSLDGRPVQRVIPPKGDVHAAVPAWSPDGTKVAFGSTLSGNWDIWVCNRDGSDLRNLTPGTERSIEQAPTWSPDGSKIAFISTRSGSQLLYTMNSSDGLNLNRVPTNSTQIDRPTWSPLNFIAYTAGNGPGHVIGIYDFTTGTASFVTDAAGDNQSPSVAPNGRHIVFETTRWGREELAVIDRRGENLRRLTNTGNNKNPSWSRTRGR